jgi:TolB protein
MGNYNARASYSPDGRSLVMVNGGSGYRIALLDLKSGSSRMLTGSNLDESPSFAPNGSMIIYATMAGRGTELAAAQQSGCRHIRIRGDNRNKSMLPEIVGHGLRDSVLVIDHQHARGPPGASGSPRRL